MTKIGKQQESINNYIIINNTNIIGSRILDG